VNEAVDPQLVLANKQHAVSPDNTGVVLVKVFPPLVYPEPVVVTSYVFVGSAVGSDATAHTVVDLLNTALLLEYKANLNASVLPVKL